jgi:cysteine synthase
MGAALAGAAWARARGIDLHQIVHGPLTHEGRKALELWGFAFEHVASAAEALRRAAQQSASATLLPPLDGSVAAAAFAASIGPELRQLDTEPRALIAPAGARAALLGTVTALRERWPRLRAIALVAASPADVLPELPQDSDLDGVELRAVTRAEAVAARAWLTRSAGLLAAHASARAVQLADELAGLALVTSAGEREFSLESGVAP